MKYNLYYQEYNKFLASHCQCYADSEGNHPCDYGCLCDRCSLPDAVKAWNKIKKEKFGM